MSQCTLSSETILVFQFGNGANSTEFGRSPGTISASDAGFPGLIRGTVTNTLRMDPEILEVEPVFEVEPELKKYFSSAVPKRG